MGTHRVRVEGVHACMMAGPLALRLRWKNSKKDTPRNNVCKPYPMKFNDSQKIFLFLAFHCDCRCVSLNTTLIHYFGNPLLFPLGLVDTG